MSEHAFTFTSNEREIMELLWVQDRPLSRSEIIELSPEKSWKASSIHILLNQLLEKGAIEVVGYTRTGKNYGRTYGAAISAEKYQLMQFKKSASFLHSKSTAIINLMSVLINDDEIDDDTLSHLETLLQGRTRR